MASVRRYLTQLPIPECVTRWMPSVRRAREPFDGYPYLLTRVVPGLAHVIPLPAQFPPDMLLAVARRQRDATRFHQILVLDASRVIEFDPYGGSTTAGTIPRGDYLITDRLLPAAPLPDTPDLVARQQRLVAHIAARRATGYLVCDGAASLARPTFEERAALAGRRGDGVPKGLAPCPLCHGWRGTAFLPPADRLVRAYCLCENWNRCARCGGPLAARRLNAHYYDPADDSYCHVPGFSGLRHVCEDSQ